MKEPHHSWLSRHWRAIAIIGGLVLILLIGAGIGVVLWRYHMRDMGATAATLVINGLAAFGTAVAALVAATAAIIAAYTARQNRIAAEAAVQSTKATEKAAAANVSMAEQMAEQRRETQRQAEKEVRERQIALLRELSAESLLASIAYEQNALTPMSLPAWTRSRRDIMLWFPKVAAVMTVVEGNVNNLNTIATAMTNGLTRSADPVREITEVQEKIKPQRDRALKAIEVAKIEISDTLSSLIAETPKPS